jgi:hypothetical protein
MPGIIFNARTKELEIKGSESFIESHFHMFEEIMKKTETGKMNSEISLETQAGELWDKERKASQTPERGSSTPARPEIRDNPAASKATRAPVRKYFNTLGKPIRSVETTPQKNLSPAPVDRAEGISIASLREKFGLSEQQIQGVIKDAERNGRIRKYLDGSYVLL